MKKPAKMDSWHRPPTLTPAYLETLRRRWSARTASVVAAALKESAI